MTNSNCDIFCILVIQFITMGYLFLILTIISETTAVICMKFSEGFQLKWYSAAAIITYMLSFFFLTMALKYLPAGIANAIWAGASTMLVAVLGIFFFKEKLSAIQVISLLLIVAGLLGLNISKSPAL